MKTVTAMWMNCARMGADIRVEGRVAVVGGAETGLRGAAVTAAPTCAAAARPGGSRAGRGRRQRS